MPPTREGMAPGSRGRRHERPHRRTTGRLARRRCRHTRSPRCPRGRPRPAAPAAGADSCRCPPSREGVSWRSCRHGAPSRRIMQRSNVPLTVSSDRRDSSGVRGLLRRKSGVSMTTTASAGRTTARSGLRRRELLDGLGFLAPFLAVYVLFLIVPVVQAVYMSGYDWDLLTATRKLIGWGNYTRMLGGTG